jgi:polar amino acid transport system substrate-binding protein
MKTLLSVAMLALSTHCLAAHTVGAVRSGESAREIAPGGTLRVGVVEAPDAGLFFVAQHPGGSVQGVTVDLGARLARDLGLPVTYDVFPTSGACTEAVHAGKVDVAFMPVDASRSAQVAFGPAYYLLESTYLVSAKSGITDMAGVDQPGVKVIGVANTTTIRASARSLSHTVPQAISSVTGAYQAMRAGDADAIALSRDSLKPLLAQIPGSRIVAGGFQQTSISIAVPPGQPAALQVATRFMQQAKSDGTVRTIFDAHGFQDEAVAPADR